MSPDGPVAFWPPKRFVRFEKALDTSMGTARIVTDAGKAYCKALGNRQGPHALACELVGTQLARWFELPTFDDAILMLDELDEIPFAQGGKAQPGPAYVTRAERGHAWGGDADELTLLDNESDVARLVVFDTWTLNCDRHPPDRTVRRPNYDNVFLSEEHAQPGRFRLVAMDHTHCFTCGRDLDERTATVARIKDEGVYGLFDGFVPAVRAHRPVAEAALDRLGGFDRDVAAQIVATIPAGWQVPERARAALVELICQRARFVADSLMRRLAAVCWPQSELPFGEGGGP
jgi:hypothetical protein